MTIPLRKTRREFLATSVTTALSIAGCASMRNQSDASSALLTNTTASGETPALSLPQSPMPKRQLGRTAVQLPVLGLGGAGKTPLNWPKAEASAIAQIERALELGIRYFDTAASYGPSETFLGKVLPAYRSEIFLASKTAGRDYDSAWRDLEQSLTRLNTD